MKNVLCIKYYVLSILLVLPIILNTSPIIQTVYASHCSSGTYSSLNSYCDPSTNTIWHDQTDCSHEDTGQPCSTFTPSTCTYNEECDAGTGPASGVHSCTGTNPNEAGQNQCGYNSAVDPACSACTPITPVPPAPAVPPAVPPTTTTPAAPPASESPEEAAIRRLADGLRPEQVPGEVTERSGIEQIVGNFFSNLGSFLNTLLKLANFIQDSRGLSRGELPQEQISNDTKPNLMVDDAFGGETQRGIYNANLPEVFPTPTPIGNRVVAESRSFDGTEDNNSIEQEFEKSNFPEWCNKITTGNCNVPVNP